MPVNRPTAIPFPVSSFPGANTQESSGRLINCAAEPLGEGSHPTGPAVQVWRRQPGLSQFNLAPTGQTGYRGGLTVVNLAYEAWSSNASTVDASGNYVSLGAFPGTKKISIARNQATLPDVIAVDLDNGAYILNTAALASATNTVTLAGTTYTSGDTLSIIINNIGVFGLPVTITHTNGGGESPTTVATALFTAINANTTLAANGITATNPSAGVLVISQPGALGNATFLSSLVTGTGNETITFSPSSGQLVGGSGTAGITFTGVPLAYNGLGALPQPNSVCFLDGYFFFTIGDGRVFATNINALTMNALTFIYVVSKADVQLIRGVAFSGLLWLFTTGNCEIWQDTAQPYPGFPFSRLLPIEFGLIQPNAIAGWETGFSELLWVAQDFGVYWCSPGATPSPIKVSPPDLDRAIEAEVSLGHTLEASAYVFAGKKFWAISSPDWTWEFNLSSKKWNERWSLQANGLWGRWRATGGHPGPAIGFTKQWLVGDTLTGNILYIDDQNYTELGAPLLFRIESGPARDFPNQTRVARADFDFDMGVGVVVDRFFMFVSNAVSGTGGVVRLTVNTTSQANQNDVVTVTGIVGTTEANGTHIITVIDGMHVELQGVPFVHAYVSGGVVSNVTPPPTAVQPVCAISMSKDGGVSWGNPLVRQLGRQARSLRVRASVKNMGLTGVQGARWRVDVTDPVYVGFLGATQANDPRYVGT
jgi:hypothetical protein